MNQVTHPYLFAGLPVRYQKIKLIELVFNDPNDILSEICRKLDVSIVDVKGQSRKREFVVARQIAMTHIRRSNPKMSLKGIGKMFGGRDHSTVLYSQNQYDELYEVDKEFTKAVNLVIDNENFKPQIT